MKDLFEKQEDFLRRMKLSDDLLQQIEAIKH